MQTALGVVAALRDSGADEVPKQLGPYEVGRQLGRGAQGSVYEAIDTRLGRRVALKVLRAPHDRAAEFYLRFQREAEAASRIDHPGICTVYEAGIEDGHPFIAMQFVDGPDLSGELASSSPGTRDVLQRRLEILERVARAIDAAHRRGLVHRDLKPGNILLTSSGEPIVCDFGLAQILAEDRTQLTRTGDVRGTPAYMAPEQITGSGTLDARADVHALGVMLYEAVTGTRPYEGATMAMLAANIVRGEPEIPRGLPRDLRVVLATALARDPARRYATAEALAEDLTRIREGRSILARPPSLARRAVRVIAHNRVVTASVAILVLGLAWFAYQQSQLAVRERAVASEVRREHARADRRAYAAQIAAADAHRRAFQARDVRAVLNACNPALRGWEWSYLWHACDQASSVGDLRTGHPAARIVVSPEGAHYFVTAGYTVSRHEVATHVKTAETKIRRYSPLAISPSGASLAVDGRGGIAILDARTLAVRQRFDRGPGRTRALHFLDDQALVLADDAGQMRVVLVREGKTLGKPLNIGGRVRTMVPASMPGELLVGTADGRILAVDPMGRSVRHILQVEEVVHALARRGDRAMAGCSDGRAFLFDPASGRIQREFPGHAGWVCAVAILEQGYATVSNRDGTMRMWGSDGRLRESVMGPDDFRDAVFVDDVVLAAGSGGVVRSYLLPSRHAASTLCRSQTKITGLDLHPSGSEVAVATEDGWTHRIDVGTGALHGAVPARLGADLAVSYSPDGAYLATAGEGCVLQVWSLESQELVSQFAGATRAVHCLAWRPDGRELAACTHRGVVRVFDWASRRQVAVILTDVRDVTDLRWHPDGSSLVVAGPKGGIRVIDRVTGRERMRRTFPWDRAVESVDVSPDGTRLAAAGMRHVRVYDYDSGIELARNHDVQWNIKRCRFDGSGLRLATVMTASGVTIRDGRTLMPLLQIEAPSPGRYMAWPRDGARLVVASSIASADAMTLGGVVAQFEVKPGGERGFPAIALPHNSEPLGSFLARIREQLQGPKRPLDAAYTLRAEIAARVARGANSPSLDLLLAMAHCRCGEFDKALPILRRVGLHNARAGLEDGARIGVWHAMALARLGAGVQAREVLARVTRRLKSKRGRPLAAELAPLVAEVDALLTR